jgi:hypothetical protein
MAINRILRATSHAWERRVTVSCAIFERSQQHRLRRVDRAVRARRMRFMDMLEHHCARLDTKIRKTETEVLATLAEHSPFHMRKSLRHGSQTLAIRLQDHLHARTLSAFTVRTQITGYLVQKAEHKTRSLLREALPASELERLTVSADSVHNIPAATLAETLQRAVYPVMRRRFLESTIDEPEPDTILAPAAAAVTFNTAAMMGGRAVISFQTDSLAQA